METTERDLQAKIDRLEGRLAELERRPDTRHRKRLATGKLIERPVRGFRVAHEEEDPDGAQRRGEGPDEIEHRKRGESAWSTFHYPGRITSSRPTLCAAQFFRSSPA